MLSYKKVFARILAATLASVALIGCTPDSKEGGTVRLYRIFSGFGIGGEVARARASLESAGISPVSEQCFRAVRLGNPNSPNGLSPDTNSNGPDQLIVWEIHKDQEGAAVASGFETKNLGDGYSLESNSCNFQATSVQVIDNYYK